MQAFTNKPSLLVVDDDPVVLEVVCESLKRSLVDVHIESTDSPKIALRQATSRRYSAVVTDVTMPVMNGLELASKIHDVHPHMPIVFISGTDQALDDCRPQAFACLRKPFDMSVFVDTVRSAVESCAEPRH
jgi:two-component system nitrogen regulation response regulator GlnG